MHVLIHVFISSFIVSLIVLSIINRVFTCVFYRILFRPSTLFLANVYWLLHDILNFFLIRALNCILIRILNHVFNCVSNCILYCKLIRFQSHLSLRSNFVILSGLCSRLFYCLFTLSFIAYLIMSAIASLIALLNVFLCLNTSL